MKTSKLDRNEEPSNPWEKFKLKLDARPSRTATVMAIILFIAFVIGSVKFVYRLNQPKPEISQKPLPSLIDQVNRSLSDSLSISDKVTEYFLLLEIQREVQEMMRDSTKMDSTRIQQLFDILNIK